MGRKTTTRMLGCADYKAQWVDGSMVVRLSARGFLPCANHYAQLEKTAAGDWEMVFYTQDSRDETYSPFCLQTIVMATEGQTSVLVNDALGGHEIRIRPAEMEATEPDTCEYIVYARKSALNVPDETYFTQPVDTKVLPIYARAYGPASKVECAAFISSANMDFMMEWDQLHAKIEQAEVGED